MLFDHSRFDLFPVTATILGLSSHFLASRDMSSEIFSLDPTATNISPMRRYSTTPETLFAICKIEPTALPGGDKKPVAFLLRICYVYTHGK
jgi:hypothetical protein